MLTVRTSENTVITSFRLISERQDFSSVRTGENTVRARARIHLPHKGFLMYFCNIASCSFVSSPALNVFRKNKVGSSEMINKDKEIRTRVLFFQGLIPVNLAR